jgi:hypothetical protein
MTNPDETELVVVASAKTEFEAHAITAILEDAGIEASAFGLVRQALPLDTKFTHVPVQVRAEDAERARQVLKQNVSDSVDLDWDEIDVGEREDQVPLSSERESSPLARAVLSVTIVLLIVTFIVLLFSWMR